MTDLQDLLSSALIERDTFMQERDAARAERNAYLLQRDIALGERNEFHRQLRELIARNVAYDREVGAQNVERDRAIGAANVQRDRAIGDLNDLRHKYDQLVVECERLRALAEAPGDTAP